MHTWKFTEKGQTVAFCCPLFVARWQFSNSMHVFTMLENPKQHNINIHWENGLLNVRVRVRMWYRFAQWSPVWINDIMHEKWDTVD